jgi:4-hydroxy 2-oxovalerate aldolase
MTKQTKGTESSQEAAKRWLSFRPDLKVIDCTIRDGGLMNAHKFEDSVVEAVYKTCVAAGIDYMEIGYKASEKLFSREENGKWKFSSEDDVRRIVGENENESGVKISIMADAERTDYKNDILPFEQSALGLIRVASYIHQIPAALDIIKDAHDKGYETTLNLMAVTAVPESELEEALETLAGSEVDVMYVVDSFGSLYSEQTAALVKLYMKYMEAAGKRVGFHAHNNQQLGYANTIQAIISGAHMVDGSMAGLGRGAGNCQIESLLSFLHNPKYHLRPVLECVEKHIEPLRADLKWGYDLPYMLTGHLNQHPREAMKFNSGADRGKITKFYDSLFEAE